MDRNILTGSLSAFPAVGRELVEADHWVGADAMEDVANLNERVDMESPAGGDEPGQDGGGLPAFIGPEEEPVFSSDGGSLQASLAPLLSISRFPSSE